MGFLQGSLDGFYNSFGIVAAMIRMGFEAQYRQSSTALDIQMLLYRISSPPSAVLVCFPLLSAM